MAWGRKFALHTQKFRMDKAEQYIYMNSKLWIHAGLNWIMSLMGVAHMCVLSHFRVCDVRSEVRAERVWNCACGSARV